MTVAGTTEPPRVRGDARRNREAILTAARELFAETADVAMCEVARRAGVGQATLYRNFANRGTLAAEVVHEHVEGLARLADEHEDDPDAFFVLLRALVEGAAQVHALAEGHERRRIAELFQRPLSRAKAAGTLRRDATVDDVFLVVLMAKGAMERAAGPASRATAASRVLTLTLDGLVPPIGQRRTR